MREFTSRIIYFCRDNGIGQYGAKNYLRPQLKPDVDNVVYDSHMYALQRLDKLIASAKSVYPDVIVGECATQPDDQGDEISLENATLFCQTFKANKLPFNWWIAGLWQVGPGNKLLKADCTLNTEGDYLKQAIKAVYG
jgi:hypothetical protein